MPSMTLPDLRPTRRLQRAVPRSAAASRQRGVVLLFALIALTILLIGSIALVRSFNTSLSTAGNISFKRDLMNQSERAVPVILAALNTPGGVLNTPIARGAHLPASNYSAAALAVNAQGIPLVLLQDTDAGFTGAANFFAGGAPVVVTSTANDINVTDSASRNQQVRVRYVLDRLCEVVGEETTLGDRCMRDRDIVPRGGRSIGARAEDTAAPRPVVYRLSIRVDGPRNTQAYYQTTFSL
jgi:type IV pilus assembly protein PilX